LKRLATALILAAALLVSLVPLAHAVHWKTIEDKHLVVYYQKESLGRAALRLAQEEQKRLIRFFRYKPSEKIKIYVYNDPLAFRMIAPNRKAIGVARPFSSEIAVLAGEELRTTISHELVHVIFLQSLPSLRGLPFWFAEGIAFYLSQPRLVQVDLERYALRGDVRHIEELSGNLSPEEEGKAAAEGYLITKFLAEKFGVQKLRTMIFFMQRGKNFYAALQASTGLNEQTLDKEWHNYGEAQKKLGSLRELRFFGFLVIALLAIIVSAYWLIKIRKRLLVEEEDLEGDQ